MKHYHIAVIFVLGVATATFASPTPKPKLSKSDAQAIALRQIPGRVKNEELEKEHGRWIYSFDIQKGKNVHEVNVDANTGAVVGNSVETAADEAQEKKADADATSKK